MARGLKKIIAVGQKKFANKLKDVLSPLGVEIIEKKPNSYVKDAIGRNIRLVFINEDDCRGKGALWNGVIKRSGKSKRDFIMISSHPSVRAIAEANAAGAFDYIISPYNAREFIARYNAAMDKKTRITCIGGGTGLFHILLGLKKLPRVLLTSVVSMSDDGGSSGKLRTTFGILPPGDVRRSLVALSNAPEIMNMVVQYRFLKGEGVKGHSFGNLFLTALSEIKGSLPEAVKALGDILNIQGIVLPVTDENISLCALFEDGTVIKGESNIDLGQGRDKGLHIKKVWHEPKCNINLGAFSSIINSDFVMIGPGDLYTSVVTNLLVSGVKEAVVRTRAKKIYLCNLMTKPGETTGYVAADHVREIVRYLGEDVLDYVVISNSRLSRKSIEEYARMGQSPVEPGNMQGIYRTTKAKVVFADIGHELELVRHDSAKIQKETSKILRRKKR